MDRRNVKVRANRPSNTNRCGGDRIVRQTSDVDESAWQDLLLKGIWYDGKHVTGDQLQSACRGLRLIYLFAGPHRDDGVDTIAQLLGAEAAMHDLDRTPPSDLADVANWAAIQSDIEGGQFDFQTIATTTI